MASVVTICARDSGAVDMTYHSTESTEVGGQVTADIHSIVPKTSIRANVVEYIATDFVIKNTGNVPGWIHLRIAEIDSEGNVVDLFGRTGFEIPPGWGAAIQANQVDKTCGIVRACDNPDDCKPDGWIKTKKPPGTYYYAIRVWGEDESPPPWPKPTVAGSALGTSPSPSTPEKWCIPATPWTPEICLEPWQWELLIGGPIVVGIGIGYILSKVWK